MRFPEKYTPYTIQGRRYVTEETYVNFSEIHAHNHKLLMEFIASEQEYAVTRLKEFEKKLKSQQASKEKNIHSIDRLNTLLQNKQEEVSILQERILGLQERVSNMQDIMSKK
tara:strand:- start:402 stop:737 length:336 start_codon:yes stop_codon:yes gene_type:complete